MIYLYILRAHFPARFAPMIWANRVPLIVWEAVIMSLPRIEREKVNVVCSSAGFNCMEAGTTFPSTKFHTNYRKNIPCGSDRNEYHLLISFELCNGPFSEISNILVILRRNSISIGLCHMCHSLDQPPLRTMASTCVIALTHHL